MPESIEEPILEEDVEQFMRAIAAKHAGKTKRRLLLRVPSTIAVTTFWMYVCWPLIGTTLLQPCPMPTIWGGIVIALWLTIRVIIGIFDQEHTEMRRELELRYDQAFVGIQAAVRARE